MLYKFLVLCLFAATVIAMDDNYIYPPVSRIPSGKSIEVENAINTQKKRLGITDSKESPTANIVQPKPEKLDEDIPFLQPFAPYPKESLPGYHKVDYSAEKRRLDKKADLVSSAFESAQGNSTNKSNLLEMLLQLPAIDPNNGNTPVHFAATKTEMPDLISQLFAKNPDLIKNIDHHNKQGITPLLVALIKQNMPALAILLKYGANPSLAEKIEGENV